MKQVFQNYKNGDILLEEVPVPSCKSGGVVVRTRFSAISPGTELMKISESKLSLIGKARSRPDQVKKVLDSVAQQGLITTFNKVNQRLETLTPLGYSTAGVVEEVGAGIVGLSVGDRVACAGNAEAYHAEFNWVPQNLLAKMPDNVTFEEASFTTIASIALHGVRQANVKAGEWVAVIGLGIVGQIAASLLVSFGARVIGFDLSAERVDLALKRGASAAYSVNELNNLEIGRIVFDITKGLGCDHIVISAGGKSNSPVELGPIIARDRAKVTVIGKCGLNLDWNAYYDKEMEIVFSRSYGPGRYDPTYEQDGVDYPVGYVRWTEQRNMQFILDLIGSGSLNIKGLISEVFNFEDAVANLNQLNSGDIKGIGFAFRYQNESPLERTVVSIKKVASKSPSVEAKGRVRIGAIGCGNYASTMLYPYLKSRDDIDLVAVATGGGSSGLNATKKFGFGRMTTDSKSVVEDPDIDTIIIATRHSSHCKYVCEALRAGKNVFVEKPLALSVEELVKIEEVVNSSGNDRLMVGFNRRFSPAFNELKKNLGNFVGTQNVIFRINAGLLEPTSWYLNRELEGGRFLGEGGHFIDMVSAWFAEHPVSVSSSVTPGSDDVTAIIKYPSGIGTIVYATNGNTRFAKERFEVFGNGCVGIIDNFKSHELWTGTKKISKSSFGINKGQNEQLSAFISSVKEGRAMPISLASLFATTRATIAASEGSRIDFDSQK